MPPSRMLLALLLAMPFAPGVARGEVIAIDDPRQARVVDGDTLQIDGRVIALSGVDAPEIGQRCRYDDIAWTCGLAAAHDLRKHVVLGRGPLRCEVQAVRGDGTREAVCVLGELDLAVIQLESGMAVTTAEAPQGYRRSEARAREARLGIWHSRFENPARWRAAVRRAAVRDPECMLRAREEADGRRLYYTLFDDAFDAVKADPASRVYCSDDNARADGYRRPGELPDG
ncbi:MAG TPA: thermonuclease family protein [Rhodospirillales bacterium]|nr:thermonuclease family protein [Rhodospirillales bacterium]